jgi:uncharacterized protein YbaP (TraB family)
VTPAAQLRRAIAVNGWRRLGARLAEWLGRALLVLVLAGSGARAGTIEAAVSDCPPVARQPYPAEVVQAAQRARDHGFLWRLERDGRVSWLYGTLHVGRFEWAFPGPKVAAALRQAKLLALELDVGSPGLQQQIAAARSRSNPQRQSAALPPAVAARLARQLALACIDPEAMAGQSPVMRGVALSVMAARRDGLDPAYAQEFLLAGYARALGMPVVSLEDAATQLDALDGGSPGEKLALLTQTLDQIESGQARSALVRLAGAWADGDLATLETYDQWCDCARDETEKAFLTRLNDDRNPALADRIAALHAQGRPVFAAVGALHMTGAKALPELLRARGFAVERVRLQAH